LIGGLTGGDLQRQHTIYSILDIIFDESVNKSAASPVLVRGVEKKRFPLGPLVDEKASLYHIR
jgi:hypothetical protein